MNPVRFQTEMDYYTYIIDQYQVLESHKDRRGIEIFVAKEINAVLRELKEETQNIPLMEDMVKNTIIILLSLFQCNSFENQQDYCDLSDQDKELLRKNLVPDIVH